VQTEDDLKIKERDPQLDISIGFWDIGNSISDEKDDYLLFLENKFNINIIPRNVTWANINQKLLYWGASSNLPDIFAGDILLSDVYYQWIEEGKIRALPEELSRFPNISRITEQQSLDKLKIKGKLYFFPRNSAPDSSYNSAERGILSRKDWREHLGFDKPQTFDEYLELAKAFVEMDPDGNGVDDTVGITFTNRNYLSAVFLSTVPEAASKTWKYEDGRWIPGYSSKDMMKGFNELSILWNEGVLDYNINTLTGYQGFERFCIGRTGMIFTQAKPRKIRDLSVTWKKYNDSDLTDLIEVLPIWLNSEGKRFAFHEGKNFWSSSYFSSNVSDIKMEKILSLYDFLLSPEGQMSLKYGIPDVDFSIKGNKVERKDDRDISIKYPSIDVFRDLAIWSLNFTNWTKDEFSLNISPENIMDMCMEQYLQSKAILNPVNMDIQYMKTPLKSRFERGDSIFDTFYKVMIADDPETEWNRQMDQLKSEGLDQAIEEVNRKALEMGINPPS